MLDDGEAAAGAAGAAGGAPWTASSSSDTPHVVMEPPLLADVLQDTPDFYRTLKDHAKPVNAMSGAVDDLASAIQEYHATGVAHQNASLKLSEALVKASHYFQLDDVDVDDVEMQYPPLERFGEAIASLQQYHDMLMKQTDFLTRGPVDQIKDDFRSAIETEKSLDRALEKRWATFAKFCGTTAADMNAASKQNEDFTRRGAKAYAAKRQARQIAADYVFELRHLATVSRVSLMQKILEQMLAQFSFFNYADNTLKEIEPYMGNLFTTLSERCRAAELLLEVEKVKHANIEHQLTTEYDNEMASLPDADKSLGLRATLKQMGKNIQSQVQKSKSPKMSRKIPKALQRYEDMDESRPSLTQASLEAKPEKKDKQGYLLRRNRKKQWQLEHFRIDDCYLTATNQKGGISQIANLQLTTVRICREGSITDRKYCFEVISPTSTTLLQAMGPMDLSEWVAALQAGIAEALHTGNADGGDEHVVTKPVEVLGSIPGNDCCADCGNKQSLDWASINLGIILCIECSGCHRNLGVHVSKVRGIQLDRWADDILEHMKSIGNIKSNEIYLPKLKESGDASPAADTPKIERQAFIRKKYVDKAYCDPEELETRVISPVFLVAPEKPPPVPTRLRTIQDSDLANIKTSDSETDDPTDEAPKLRKRHTHRPRAFPVRQDGARKPPKPAPKPKELSTSYGKTTPEHLEAALQASKEAEEAIMRLRVDL